MLLAYACDITWIEVNLSAEDATERISLLPSFNMDCCLLSYMAPPQSVSAFA